MCDRFGALMAGMARTAAQAMAHRLMVQHVLRMQAPQESGSAPAAPRATAYAAHVA
jgi:hypothetical protein